MGLVEMTTTRDGIKARFDALLDRANLDDQERDKLRADFARVLADVDGLGTFEIEIGDWTLPTLDDWQLDDLKGWDFSDVGEVLAGDRAQLDALTKPTHCPYCGQPMPSEPSEGSE